MWRVNVDGTMNVVEAAARCSPKPRVVYASSSGVNGCQVYSYIYIYTYGFVLCIL